MKEGECMWLELENITLTTWLQNKKLSSKLFIRASFSIRDLTDKYAPSLQSISSSAFDDQVFNL